MSFREYDFDARRAATFRLGHDVGKAARWSAPASREPDADALRARLAADLAPIPERFDRWRAADGATLESDASLAAALAEIASAVDAIRAANRRLEKLDLSELVALDETAARVETSCRALHRAVVAMGRSASKTEDRS